MRTEDGEEFLTIKRIAIHTRSSSHDVVVTRLLCISFLSRSFCLNSYRRLSSRELPSKQGRGSCDARGRKTGRLRARVRKKDEARQAQTENMATMVLFSGHHCMAASVLPPRMRATKNSLHAGGSNRLYRSASIWQQIAPEWPAGRAYKR